ncbi:beta strand repeat-containing protein, partial [Escherichia coli]|uniref:beta strand repeat-containing protein n=1 Tax=Escherichia coli TaxID=562 RepID=UPI00201AF20C
SGSIQTPSGNQMNIHQNSQNMVANWNSFDIGKGNTVQFDQPSSSAVALNRVVGGGESQIMGNLKANGQVFLVNPNGVLFGEGASVSTSGFVASTRDIKNDDFMSRRYTFSGGQKAGAAIVNQGELTTNAGGYIVLAADRVSNSGTIRTPGGKTVLAASERVTLQLDNGGLMSAQVTGDVVNALVENRGLVSARDGQVYLTALGREMLMNTVLNVSGVVEASGMHRQDGNIVLDGGDSGVVHLSGTLQADNASGQGGKVVVQGKNILLDKGSSITATGGQGGGEVYVGGGWQGKDSNIRNADKVVMQGGARIDVSATQQGNGGTAVLWSDSYTNFHGQISAKGGETGGNGGQVETSSHGNLQAFGSVSASAKKGKAGNWLLDPLDITIVNGNDADVNKTNDTQSQPPHTQFAPTAAGSNVSNTSINNELNNGTSVTILTSSTVASGNQNGNITVNAEINKSSGGDANLTLLADGDITVNSSITSTKGKLNVNLSGARTSNGNITISNSASITTNGGDITVGTANTSNRVNISINHTTLNTTNANNSGNISITGSRVDITYANITAGNFTLNATATGSDITNTTLTATNDINLTATTNDGHSGFYLENTNITSADGNITVNSTAVSAKAMHLNNNVTLNASKGNISMTGTANNNIAVHLQGGTFAAKNISITGQSAGANTSNSVNISNHTILNTTNTGNINITASRVDIKGANITAGNFTLNATATGLEISNTTLTAKYDINLTATTNSSSSGVYLKDANITSTDGNITANGTATNQGTATHLDQNVTLNASKGNIKLSGRGKNGYGIRQLNSTLRALNNINLTGTAGNQTAVYLQGGTFAARNISITGQSTDARFLSDDYTNDMSSVGKGVHLNGRLTFDGNTAIHGTGNLAAGVLLDAERIQFNNGTATITGNNTGKGGDFGGSTYTAAIAVPVGWNWNKTTTIALENSNLTITAKSEQGPGMIGGNNDSGRWSQNKIVFSGQGNVSVTSSGGYYGYSDLSMDASTLNGSASLHGTSVNNAGVKLTNTIMNNITIIGKSENDAGVHIGGESTLTNTNVRGESTNHSGVKLEHIDQFSANPRNDNVNLINSSLSGSSVNGSGVSTSINLSNSGNSTITGTASGNGNGVNISGSVTGGNITGSATGNGSGVSTSGNSTLTNTTVNGSGMNGSGVNISGNLSNSGNSTITGTASGNGNGVNISGSVTGGNITGSATGNGNGVNISGSVTGGNITGSATGNGNGVNISGSVTGGNITGSATGNGNGVNISGSVTGGNITGSATGNGSGVSTSGNSTLTN